MLRKKTTTLWIIQYSVLPFFSVIGNCRSSDTRNGWSASARWRNSPGPSRRKLIFMSHNIPAHDACLVSFSCTCRIIPISLNCSLSGRRRPFSVVENSRGYARSWRCLDLRLFSWRLKLDVVISPFLCVRLGGVEWGKPEWWNWRVSSSFTEVTNMLVELSLRSSLMSQYVMENAHFSSSFASKVGSFLGRNSQIQLLFI